MSVDERSDKEKRSDYREYTKNRLQEDVEYIKQKVDRLDHVLFGTRESSTPEGIIHEVGKNKDFRNNITRWFWIVATQLTIIILFLIYSVFKNGSL